MLCEKGEKADLSVVNYDGTPIRTLWPAVYTDLDLGIDGASGRLRA